MAVRILQDSDEIEIESKLQDRIKEWERLGGLSSSEVHSKWHKALFEEDCLEVMALLRKKPDLVMVGWKPDDSLEVEGSWPNYWMPTEVSKWKGRTALHVGARRGCVELIKQVCTLFKVEVGMEGFLTQEDFGVPGAKPATSNDPEFQYFDMNMEDDIIARNIWSHKTDDLLKDSGDETIEIATSPPSKNTKLGDVLRKENVDAITSDEERGRSAAGGFAKTDGKQNIFLCSTSQSEIARDVELEDGSQQSGTQLQTEADLASLAHSKVEVEGHLPVKSFKRGGDNEDGQDSHLDASAVSVKSFDEFYHSKDGRYNLEAFAMAVLNGNFDVISLLADAYLHLRSVEQRDRLDVEPACMLGYLETQGYYLSENKEFLEWKEAAQKEEVERILREEKKRTLLRKVVKKTIAEFISITSDEKILERAYSKHRDFNFLPQVEFIFHYLVTIPAKEWVQENVGPDKLKLPSVLVLFWDRVKREPEDEDLWKFVLQLQDGQGRTPSHAALDEGELRFDRLRQTLGRNTKAWKFVTEEVVDGAGRTLMHKALACEHWDVVESLLRDPSDYEMLSSCCERFRHFAPRDLLRRKGLVLDVDFLSQQNGFHGIKSYKNKYKDMKEYIASKAFFQMYLLFIGIKISIFTSKVFPRLFKRKNRLPYMEAEDECIQEWRDWITQGTGPSRVPTSDGDFYRNLAGGFFAFSVPLYYVLSPSALESNDFSLKLVLRMVKSVRERGDMKGRKQSLPLYPCPLEVRIANGRKMVPKGFGPAEFAVLSGDVELARNALKIIRADRTNRRIIRYPEKLPIWTRDFTNDVTAFHLAASQGNYEMLKLCIDHSEDFLNNNVFAEDLDGNTPLHYALQGKISLSSHLLDYVSCSYIGVYDDLRSKTENSLDDDIVGRKGCINLLLETGCDMFKENKYGELPHPSGAFKSNQQLIEWWYDKRIKEFESIQSAMSVAANAISVTAALVATASYIGPLQPPLGYGGSSSDLQVEIIWVRMFIVCDTLSFYLAVGAIICSLIPSLPVPQQAMIDELRRTRSMVSLAVAILFPSVVLVLLAFVASSIAVISSNPSSLGGSLTFVATAVGTLIFAMTALLFLVRFFIVILPRNSWMKYIYKNTSF